MSKLIIVSAPSGAGKTTLCRKLLEELKGQLVLSVSCTTRAPREGEIPGQQYHFLTVDAFKAKIEAGDFAEWALVHGNYYGTSRAVIDQTLHSGKSVLLEIDVQGAEILRQAYQGRCFSVFISPPSLEELRARLEKRATDSAETIAKRILNARNEMARAGEFDLQMINDDFDRAYSELLKQVSAHV